jgi:hypothetical protein
MATEGIVTAYTNTLDAVTISVDDALGAKCADVTGGSGGIVQ